MKCSRIRRPTLFNAFTVRAAQKQKWKKMGLEYAGMALSGVREDHSASGASFRDLRGIGERFRQLENSTSIRTLARGRQPGQCS